VTSELTWTVLVLQTDIAVDCLKLYAAMHVLFYKMFIVLMYSHFSMFQLTLKLGYGFGRSSAGTVGDMIDCHRPIDLLVESGP